MKFQEVADKITKEIIEEMQNGNAVWQKCWSSAGAARNYTTGRNYEGFNQLYLSYVSAKKGYTAPYFLSYKQAQELGGHVRKGERSTVVIYWKIAVKENKGNQPEKGENKLLFYPFIHNVFNIDQVEGVEWKLPEAVTRNNTPIEEAASIILNMPNPPSLAHGGSLAYYSTLRDHVQMPHFCDFNSSEEYYSTLFHEYIHATGHSSRLDRFKEGEKTARFGDAEYSKEELTAEIGAAYLAAVAGIVNKTFANSIAYLQGWIKRLKEDSTLIIYAANKALKGAAYILGEQLPPAAEAEGQEGQPESLKIAA